MKKEYNLDSLKTISKRKEKEYEEKSDESVIGNGDTRNGIDRMSGAERREKGFRQKGRDLRIR
ncbi:hypothetical protein GCM10008922_45980 [Faecalicatena contorta]